MMMDPCRAQRILVVDDNPFITSLLQHSLTAEGYEVTVAGDGLEALGEVAARPPDLILLDLDLPSLRGDEVCRRLKRDAATRLIPVVMVTAAAESRNKIAAWDNGADEFLTKPFHIVEVAARCRSLLRMRRLVEERDSAESVVVALARAVEAKSPYTHGHSERVTRYCLELAKAVGLPKQDCELLKKGSLLHDIGKISIPDVILNKPGALTAEEYDAIRQHPEQGAHIVEPLASVRDAGVRRLRQPGQRAALPRPDRARHLPGDAARERVWRRPGPRAGGRVHRAGPGGASQAVAARADGGAGASRRLRAAPAGRPPAVNDRATSWPRPSRRASSRRAWPRRRPRCPRRPLLS
jgi:putative nucleotidyltransferase with HDIG domain